MGKRRRIAIVALSAALYGASFLLPTAPPFNPKLSSTPCPGYYAFELGTRALLDFVPADIDCWLVGAAWFSNPATWLTIILVAIGRWRAGFIAGVLSLVLGLAVLPRYYLMIAGLPGYWAWIASPTLLAAAGALELTRTMRRPGESLAWEIT